MASFTEQSKPNYWIIFFLILNYDDLEVRTRQQRKNVIVSSIVNNCIVSKSNKQTMVQNNESLDSINIIDPNKQQMDNSNLRFKF